MMKARFLQLGGLCVFLLLIAGCAAFSEYGKLEKSARENYVRGSYDQAITEVVQSLKRNPEYEKSLGLVKEVFPMAVDYHMGKIKEAKGSSAKFHWDTVVSEYGALIRINQEVKSLPNLADKKAKEPIRFDVRDYSQELSEARNNAAEDHYQEGRRLFGKEGIVNRDQAAKEFSAASGFVAGYKDASSLAAEGYYQEGLILSKKEDVDVQKQAAKAFTAAQRYVPGYKDASALYERSRKAGIKRIAIIPFEDKSGKNGQYGAVADTIVDGIVSNIMSDTDATEFLEIVSRDQLEQVVTGQKLAMSGIMDVNSATQVGKILGVHEILTGQITQVSVTPERTMDRRTQDKNRVVVRTEKYRDDKGKERERDIWGDVAANVTNYTRTAGASISGSYKVVEVKTAKLKDTQQFKGTYDFKTEWATFSGDERALSDTSKSLASTSEQAAPVAEEMVSSATRDLIDSLSSTLKRYAR